MAREKLGENSEFLIENNILLNEREHEINNLKYYYNFYYIQRNGRN